MISLIKEKKKFFFLNFKIITPANPCKKYMTINWKTKLKLYQHYNMCINLLIQVKTIFHPTDLYNSG